jgi:hypothetical protein
MYIRGRRYMPEAGKELIFNRIIILKTCFSPACRIM